MTRFCLAVLGGLVCLAGARGQTAAIQANISTINYVQSLQAREGGFLPAKDSPKATLRATSAGVRAIKYLGGKVPHQAAHAKFVKSCYDPASGGFGDTPGGKPDVFSTAVGIMAVAALDMPVNDYRKGVLEYLGKNVKGFDDIRIAVAGFEAINATSSHQDEWLELVIRKRNPDGDWGKGPATARDTGSAVVAVLRMKGPVVKRENVLQVLKGGQMRDGGWAKAGAAGSDLETTYRVMRAFMMFKERPSDVEGVRSFIAKCRNSDHGYGVAPNEPSSVGAVYYAAIITHWLAKE
jgi:prenyltransferase beta subunit